MCKRRDTIISKLKHKYPWEIRKTTIGLDGQMGHIGHVGHRGHKGQMILRDRIGLMIRDTRHLTCMTFMTLFQFFISSSFFFRRNISSLRRAASIKSRSRAAFSISFLILVSAFSN